MKIFQNGNAKKMLPVLTFFTMLFAGNAVSAESFQYRVVLKGLKISEQEGPETEPPVQGAAPSVRTVVAPSGLTLSWGAVEVGTTQFREVVLRNDAAEGGQPLSVSAAVTGSPAFGLQGNTCSDIPAGGTCSITIRFNPSGGFLEGNLTLSSVNHEDLILTLNGSGAGDPHWSKVTGLFRFTEASSPFINAKDATSNLIWSTPQDPYRDPYGKFGTASALNGIDRRLTGSSSLLNLSNDTPMTIEAWTRIDGPSEVSPANWQGSRILTRLGDGTALQLTFLRWPSQAGALPNFLCLSWDNSTGPKHAQVCEPVSLTTGQWYHTAVAHDGGTTRPRLYLNGKRLSGGNYSNPDGLTPRTGPNNNLFIGAHWSGANYRGHFPGSIDDLRITVGVARYTDSFEPPTYSFMPN